MCPSIDVEFLCDMWKLQFNLIIGTLIQFHS